MSTKLNGIPISEILDIQELINGRIGLATMLERHENKAMRKMLSDVDKRIAEIRAMEFKVIPKVDFQEEEIPSKNYTTTHAPIDPVPDNIQTYLEPPRTSTHNKTSDLENKETGSNEKEGNNFFSKSISIGEKDLPVWVLIAVIIVLVLAYFFFIKK